MIKIRERSKQSVVFDEEGARYAGCFPPVEPASASTQGKKNRKKKREKNSWKNGSYGAVNPKWARGFLRTTQLSGGVGRRRKIEEIPSFRNVVSRNPAQGYAGGFNFLLASAPKLFSFSMIRQSPNKIIKAGERACLAPVAVRKNELLTFASILSIRYSMPWQASVNCLASQRYLREVIPVAEPLSTLTVVSLPVLQQQQPGNPVPVQSIPELPPLIGAVIHLNDQLLEQLLRDLPSDAVNARDEGGNVALHHAVRQQSLRAVKLLLENSDTDPSVQNNQGNTPLIEAVKIGNNEAIKLLLQHEALDVTIVNFQNVSALDIIKVKGDRSAIMEQPEARMIKSHQATNQPSQPLEINFQEEDTQKIKRSVQDEPTPDLELLKQDMGMDVSENCVPTVQRPHDANSNLAIAVGRIPTVHCKF